MMFFNFSPPRGGTVSIAKLLLTETKAMQLEGFKVVGRMAIPQGMRKEQRATIGKEFILRRKAMSNDNYKRDEHGNMYWTEYYKDLNIPSDWENVSYSNDELPSFSCNGYTIWINSPLLEERKENYLGIGFKDLSNYEDWIYAITYTRDYGEVCREDEFRTCNFDEVVEFVNKPTLYGLIGVLEYEFNYKLPFRDWKDEEVIKFIKDLLNGKTEYFTNETFPRQTFINFIKEVA